MANEINILSNENNLTMPNESKNSAAQNQTKILTLKDGTKIDAVNSLIAALEEMNDSDFTNYADNKKNNFADWIETTFKDKDLANKMRKITDRNLTIWILKNNEIKKEPENPDNTDASNNKNNPEPQKKENDEPNNKNKTDHVRFLEFFKKKLFKNKKTENIIINDKPEYKDDPEEEIEVYNPKYVKTGITGFDELIQEGIPQGSCVLLCGGAGTGKTTFSLQILNNSAEKGEKCLYLTFEEEPAKLRSHMKNYGWDPVKLEKQGLLRIKKMQSFEISRCVEALLAKASGELIINIDELDGIIPNDFKPDKIVLDSLSAVSAAFIGKEEGYRIYIDQLFTMFKDIGATSFLISEVEENTNKYTRSGVEEFLADGVFVLYNLRQKNVRIQAIEIIKIRGTDFQKKIVPFKIIAKKGIVVFPKEDPFVE